MQHVCLVHLCFFLSSPGAHLALHVLTPSFPTRRSSDLQQRQPVGFGEPDLAQHDRRYRRNVVGIERDERRETAVARDRARAVAAHRLGDPWPQYGKRVQAAANIVLAQLIATLSQNIGELSPRGDARTADRKSTRLNSS